jgi:beta-alanine--pyruvate transaminase
MRGTFTEPAPKLPARTGNEISLEHFWMPFTANRQFKRNPRLLASASGMFYRDVDGNEVLDGTSGLWCVNAGHGRAEIADAVHDQLLTLDYAPTFQMGHPIVFRLAEQLARIAPFDLDRVFFTNSGSESVDTALKIARAYHRARGEDGRFRFIGRERGYHGVNFGGASVGGIANNRRRFEPLLPGCDHLPHTHDLTLNAFSDGLPERGAELADALEGIVALHGAETIAAVIVEPVAGSAGVLLPPRGYLERLREITARHGILLIFDEVITGFGRLGASFAAELFEVRPDIITTAKALTNGAIPMGAVFVARGIHDALMHGPDAAIELFHGYTCSGHPAAAAAGLATLEMFRKEDLFTRASVAGAYLAASVSALRTAPHVVDIRALGMVAGIELESRDGAPGARAYDLFVECFKRGVLIRVTGDIVALSPPLIAENIHIDRLTEVILSSLQSID